MPTTGSEEGTSTVSGVSSSVSILCGEMLRWTLNVISDDNVTWQRNLREGRTERSRKFCSQEAAKGVSAKCL